MSIFSGLILVLLAICANGTAESCLFLETNAKITRSGLECISLIPCLSFLDSFDKWV